MEEIGPDSVREKVGADPTGLPFNSVIALELHNGKSLSPLVNAGAIATASLVPGDTADARWNNILECQCGFAGRRLKLSNEVNQSNRRPIFTTAPLPGCFTVPVLATAIRWRPWIFIRANVQRL